MDRIECYIAGQCIADGFYDRHDATIECRCDDFENCLSMFETYLNSIVHAENVGANSQLELARSVVGAKPVNAVA
jgi:hypothetical protein